MNKLKSEYNNIYMGIKSFFNKAGNSTKKLFTKDTANAAKSMFRKAEDTAQMIKKEAPGFVDTALRKTSNTLREAAPVVGTIGKAISMASPALAGVPGIGVGLAAGGAALGAGLSNSERGIRKTGQLVGDIRNEVKRPPNRGIQKSKPVEEESEMFGNLFV